jgi:hypothetical protein
MDAVPGCPALGRQGRRDQDAVAPGCVQQRGQLASDVAAQRRVDLLVDQMTAGRLEKSQAAANLFCRRRGQNVAAFAVQHQNVGGLGGQIAMGQADADGIAKIEQLDAGVQRPGQIVGQKGQVCHRCLPLRLV